jgi:hypothetical protein
MLSLDDLSRRGPGAAIVDAFAIVSGEVNVQADECVMAELAMWELYKTATRYCGHARYGLSRRTARRGRGGDSR